MVPGRRAERPRAGAPLPSVPVTDVLAAYECTVFAHDGAQRTVYRRGSGPAVIVVAEMPGITPKVVEFADRVAAIGCTAVLPHLFGEPGRDPYVGGRFARTATMLRSVVPA